jgi:hypothetical protein
MSPEAEQYLRALRTLPPAELAEWRPMQERIAKREGVKKGAANAARSHRWKKSVRAHG